MRGSLTVEAACVFPICFLVILLICYLGVYQYNLAVLRTSGYECILRSMEERELEKEFFIENLLQRAIALADERTIGVKNLDVSVKLTATKILLTYNGTQSVLESPMEVTAAYTRIYPEVILRLERGMTGERNEGKVEERFK